MMEKESILKNLGDTDVFSFAGKTFLVEQVKTSLWETLQELAKKLAENLDVKGFQIFGMVSKHYDRGGSYRAWEKEPWCFDAIDCEVLQVGASGWQKGKLKIKVTVEFEPETPLTVEASSSPLDNLRAVSEN
jgi:hypothetical protein